MTGHVKQYADIVITRTDTVGPTGQNAMAVEVTRADGKYIAGFTISMDQDIADYTDGKVLTVVWLMLGLFKPLVSRTEVLSDHGLSRANFQVTEDGIEIARAYRELTGGGDITEAI